VAVEHCTSDRSAPQNAITDGEKVGMLAKLEFQQQIAQVVSTIYYYNVVAKK